MMLVGPLVVWLLVTIFGPYDITQGVSSKLLYIHVPTVWIAYLAYTLTFLYSALYLYSKKSKYDSLAVANAKSGVVFTIVTLLSGSYWGKQTWGTWWVWDARLTSELVLFFIYLGHIFISNAYEDKRKGDRYAAILTLLGIVNLPIIKWSVEWWNTLHQPASISKFSSPSIDPSMMLPLFLMVFSFLFFFLSLVLLRIKGEVISRKLEINFP